MKFQEIYLTEALNPSMVDAMKAIREKIAKDEKCKKYIDEFQPNTDPFAYVLSKGNRYSLHCHLKWSEVAKKATEVVKDNQYQQEMEETVADKVGDRILSHIIAGDYSEYSPKVKRNGVVLEVILSVAKEKKAEPANIDAKEEPISQGDATNEVQ